MSSHALPKERLTAYQRWELASFDAARPDPVAAPSAGELGRLRDQAREEGLAAGHRDGLAKAAAESARLAEVVSSLAGPSPEFDQALAGELLGLALAIARQVVRRAIELHPESIVPVIEELLRELPHARRRSHLVVNPADAALVRSRLGERLSRSGVLIAEDPQVKPGGCRLETPESEFDATLEQRWQRVAAGLGLKDDWID